MKTKKTKKSGKWRGNTTYGHGARKKWKGSGHHGGTGMAGTGKRADHKKSLIIKLYGNKYFGKQGITSKSTEKKRVNVINLGDIEKNFNSLIKKYGKNKEIELKEYKILGEGEIKEALIIKAKAFSEIAKQKIEKVGGSAILVKIKEEIKKKEVNKEEKTEVKKEKAVKEIKKKIK